MPWFPSDADFLTLFGAVLAAGSTLFAVVSAISQYSTVHMARRTFEWTSTALDTEVSAPQRAVLERLSRRAQGELIGARYVPVWRFAEAILWTFLAPLILVLTIGRSWQTVAVAAVAGLLVLALTFRRAVRLYCERRRVVAVYVQGESDVEPVRLDLVQQMEGGQRAEFVFGAIGAASLMGAAALIAWSFADFPASLRLIVPLGSVMICVAVARGIRDYAERMALVPMHPAAPKAIPDPSTAA